MKIQSTIHLSPADRCVLQDALQMHTVLDTLSQRKLGGYMRDGRNGVLTKAQVYLLHSMFIAMTVELNKRDESEASIQKVNAGMHLL
jgi:hypothetical protein